MAETFRRSKIERFVKLLEEELPDLEKASKDENPHGMGIFYEGCKRTQENIISKLKREFKLKEDQK